MKIIEIEDRNDELLNTLVNVWEDSVKATHTFLNEQEIEHIKEYVPMALKNVWLEERVRLLLSLVVL